MRRGHVALRTCLVCRVKKEKKILLRYAVQADGSLQRDTLTGRGYYVCDDSDCLRAFEKKAFFKSDRGKRRAA